MQASYVSNTESLRAKHNTVYQTCMHTHKNTQPERKEGGGEQKRERKGDRGKGKRKWEKTVEENCKSATRYGYFSQSQLCLKAFHDACKQRDRNHKREQRPVPLSDFIPRTYVVYRTRGQTDIKKENRKGIEYGPNLTLSSPLSSPVAATRFSFFFSVLFCQLFTTCFYGRYKRTLKREAEKHTHLLDCPFFFFSFDRYVEVTSRRYISDITQRGKKKKGN